MQNIEKKRNWSDDEVKALIEMWRNAKILFNAKHPLHDNKNEI